MNQFTLILTAGTLAFAGLGSPQQGNTLPDTSPLAQQSNKPASPKPDKAAMAAVKVHYSNVGCYMYGYQVNIENTDNHRAVAVVIETPNSNDPFKPYVGRFTVYPRQFQSVCYVMFPNGARVIDAKFVE